MKIGITDYAEKYIEEHTTRKKYYSEESYNKIKQQLEEYENMRKEAIDFIKKHIRIDDEYPAYMEMLVEEKNDLLNILNKVGGSDE